MPDVDGTYQELEEETFHFEFEDETFHFEFEDERDQQEQESRRMASRKAPRTPPRRPGRPFGRDRFAALTDALGGAIQAAKETSGKNNQDREAFVQNFLNQARKLYPNCNVVICHPPHEATGNYIHDHKEVPITLAFKTGSIGYDIYAVRKGEPFTFVNKGDGGWINWGFIGDFIRSGHGGKRLTARTTKAR